MIFMRSLKSSPLHEKRAAHYETSLEENVAVVTQKIPQAQAQMTYTSGLNYGFQYRS
jgi:hypothetical protein